MGILTIIINKSSNFLVEVSAELLCPPLGTKFCVTYSVIEHIPEEAKELWRNQVTDQAKGGVVVSSVQISERFYVT